MDDHPTWNQIASTEYGYLIRDLWPVNIGVVNYNDSPIPLIVLHIPEGVTHNIDENSDFSVIFDLINVHPYQVHPYQVHPYQVPLYSVLVSAFHDKGEPICMIRPIPATNLHCDHGLPDFDEVWQGIKSMNWRLPHYFCNAERACGLVVTDHNGHQTTNKIVNINTPYDIIGEDEDRFSELAAAIKFLDGRAIQRNYSVYYLAATTLVNFYCLPVKKTSGEAEVCPANRNLTRSRSEIFSLVLDNGRLVRREHIAERNLGDFGLQKYDVFISYAHVEHELADRLAAYLQAEWPSLRVFISDPENKQEFENDPNFFIRASRQSKTIIFLASPNSIDRPMAQAEVGLNADKVVYCLFYGWPDRKELDSRLKDNIYISIPKHNVFNIKANKEFNDFLQALATDLNLKRFENIIAQNFDEFEFEKHPVYYELGRKYYEDYKKIERAEKQKQTVEEATKKLDEVISLRCPDGEVVKEYILSQGPHHKLCYLLDIARNTGQFSTILDQFPALVDEKLVDMLNGFYKGDPIKGKWIPPLIEEIKTIIKKKNND